MKLVMFMSDETGPAPRAGLLQDDLVYDLEVNDILEGLDKALSHTGKPHGKFYKLDSIRLAAPTPQPPSFRDFMTYERHFKNALSNAGREVPPEFYEFPVFYFSNPLAIYGPSEPIPYPAESKALDCEFEWAVVINQDGRNIKASEAERYIAGFTLLNDWSARDLQFKEMAVGLGPAKGKDFATTVGPYLITPDELADRYENGRYNLATVWRINGQEKSRNNANTQYYTIGQCIERASASTWIRRGDLIGFGTIGDGCLAEEAPDKRERFLQVGDVIEMEIERLGILRSVVGESR